MGDVRAPGGGSGSGSPVAVPQVELLVMKALSVGLIKGNIDEVDQKVQMTWVQPRVLDLQQVSRLLLLGRYRQQIPRSPGLCGPHMCVCVCSSDQRDEGAIGSMVWRREGDGGAGGGGGPRHPHLRPSSSSSSSSAAAVLLFFVDSSVGNAIKVLVL